MGGHIRSDSVAQNREWAIEIITITACPLSDFGHN